METMRQDCAILSHQLCGQQGGGTSTHVAPWCERNLDREREREQIKHVSKNLSMAYLIHGHICHI